MQRYGDLDRSCSDMYIAQCLLEAVDAFWLVEKVITSYDVSSVGFWSVWRYYDVDRSCSDMYIDQCVSTEVDAFWLVEKLITSYDVNSVGFSLVWRYYRLICLK